MRHPHCQHESREGVRICGTSGRSSASRCPAGGHQLPSGAAFCGHCRSPVAGQGPAAAPASLMPRPRLPHASMPPRCAKNILISRTAPEGERTQVTVLFADPKGYMEEVVASWAYASSTCGTLQRPRPSFVQRGQ